jgi:serine/threonine protein kinase
MSLQRGQLFHNRYLLVKALGQGASADVWMAQDTRANNLLVALKIFAQNSEFDSYGLQNFEREFTTVYNMKQSNLLPPTGYDICDGRPYLVMQYCENGSCHGLAGRMDEDDIIKFMHDVSAGLEYLHDHNIIHQDIKPDNILLDDNCNYMVTDFGISVSTDGSFGSSNGMSGGTRAYMGPERFEGVVSSASDMWSLGATAVELLIGDPPYGEHGGLLQAEGEPLPALPKLQPEVAAMIVSCLERDPEKRIKANEIRQKIELYWETGKWTAPSSINLIAKVATIAAAIVMCLGIYAWDYTRTKVYYYKDYAEYWGVPKGIGRLSSNEMSHREMSYKFEYCKHKLRRLSLVNSAGKVISHKDTELANSRYSDVSYYYTDNGQLDYATISDCNGCVLYKMDYDENLKTVTFRQNDEYGTELNLEANTNVLYKNNQSVFEERSRISRYLLTYDDDGLVIERKYVGLQNVPACDKDKIYGSRYKYDDKGRKIEEDFIGSDGEIKGNEKGLAIRLYTYDDNNDWTSVTYLNAERKGSHDGNNCSVVKLEYDKYGNRIFERYYTADEEPSIRTDLNVSGLKYEFDDNGNQIVRTCLGTDGSVSFCNAGFAIQRFKYDDNGFITEISCFDDNNKPTMCNFQDEYYCTMKLKIDDKDLPLEISYYDENGRLFEQTNGASRVKNAFNEQGFIARRQFFNSENKPVLIDGFYNIVKFEYDEFNRVVLEAYYDKDEKAVTTDGTISKYAVEYNRQGAITKVSYLDTTGNLVLTSDLTAGYTIAYDELGNQKYQEYFDASQNPTKSDDGYSKIEYFYDDKTNNLIGVKKYTPNGNVVVDAHYKYDARGNKTEEYALTNGKLKSGDYVTHYEYDVNNHVTQLWASDLSGNKVNVNDGAYSVIKCEFDNMGNCTERTFWKANGTPGTDEQKTHRRVQEFDAMNRTIGERNYGTDGKPVSGTGVNPEGKVKYDQWGNRIELSCYDGYGRPHLSSDGVFIAKSEYNRRGQLIKREFLGLDRQPTRSKSAECAKLEYQYDKHGNNTEIKYYDTTKCIRIEKLSYNDRNRLTEYRICDSSGKLSDKEYGISRMTIDYDAGGVTPTVKKYYTQNGTLLGKQTWNSKNKDWNPIN